MASSENTEERLRAALADRYRIERQVGSGGMATVYLALDLKHDRQVAVKVLDPDLAQNLGAERFLREIKTAASLTHPHILPLFDSGEADRLLYFVMPYVEGESLRTRLTREKQLPVEDAIQITREIADALAYAHEEGVIHRDVKPENILLEAGHAVLADFGIAQAVAGAQEDRITRTGTSVGTTAYMSPEQATGEPDLDGRTDQYSLGCVLFEMLSGDTPYLASTPQAVIAKKLSDPVPRISVVRETVSARVEDALRKALAKSPADRFGTAKEFTEALASAPGSAEGRSARLLVPGRVGLAAAFVAVGGLVLLNLPRADDPGDDRPILALLPLDNLSPDGEVAHFADGVHEDLTTRLAQISALDVISRSSVEQFRDRSTRPPIPEMSRLLGGVDMVLEGSVRVGGGTVRVTVQLIEAETDIHVWSEAFDRPYSVGAFIAIQDEIAEEIASSLQVTLTPEEKTRLANIPTENTDAYNLFLQAVEYHDRSPGGAETKLAARALYERAIVLDPAFAMAFARLSHVLGQLYRLALERTPEVLAYQEAMADSAMALDPDLPWAHRAAGWVHMTKDEFQEALDDYAIALEKAPNDPAFIAARGYAHRRAGNWDLALEDFERARRLDPRNASLFRDLGGHTFVINHRYSEATEAYGWALELIPGWVDVAWRRAIAYCHLQGNLDSLRALVAESPNLEWWRRWDFKMLEGRPEDAISDLPADLTDVYDNQLTVETDFMYAGWTHWALGDEEAAHAAFDSARVLLEEWEREHPGDSRVHGGLGSVYAGLGRSADAARRARLHLESHRHDALNWENAVTHALRVYAAAGLANDFFSLVDRHTQDLGQPHYCGLKYGFHFDPIRSDPRFMALLEKLAPVGEP